MTDPLKSFERNRTQIDFSGTPGRTKQSFRDECDVNQILKRWRKTGEMNHIATRQPTYGDFDNADDYLTATLKVQAAQEDFDTLSARVRARMENDPAELLRFVADPNNEAEAIELGLIPKPASTPPAPPPATSPESPPEPPPEGGVVSGGE